jgi:hypothetical protein
MPYSSNLDFLIGYGQQFELIFQLVDFLKVEISWFSGVVNIVKLIFKYEWSLRNGLKTENGILLNALNQ